MGIAGMWWRFENGPPTMEQLAERLSARCGLPVSVRGNSPTTGILTVLTLDSPIEVDTTEGGELELLLGLFTSEFVWTHLEAAVADLGGERSPNHHIGLPDPSRPAWTTRPWSQIGAWRRFTLLHPTLIYYALLPLNVALTPFRAVRHRIHYRRWAASSEGLSGPEDR